MPTANGLQISATGASGAVLSPAQKRFNTLIRQIEKARQTLAAWQVGIAQYQQSHVKKVQPLRVAHAAMRREWTLALDALFHQPGWSHAERETISELVRDAAADLLADDENDAPMRALFDKHSEVDYETQRSQALQQMKTMAKAMTGIDLGDDTDIRSHDDLMARLQQGFASAAEAEAQAQGQPGGQVPQKPPRRPTAAEKRRQAEAELASRSVREIYRKLASALHPDREPDEAQRAAKTGLMQQANAAYASNDLLSLLELQLRIEQVDVDNIGKVTADRLRHYNKVLAEQLEELKTEIGRTELKFSRDFDLGAGFRIAVEQLPLVIDQAARQLVADTARDKKEIRLFSDKAATRPWLKRQRRRLAQAAFDDDDGGSAFFY